MLIIENLEIMKIINYLYTHLPWDKHFVIIFYINTLNLTVEMEKVFLYLLSTYIPNSLEIQNYDF